MYKLRGYAIYTVRKWIHWGQNPNSYMYASARFFIIVDEFPHFEREQFLWLAGRKMSSLLEQCYLFSAHSVSHCSSSKIPSTWDLGASILNSRSPLEFSRPPCARKTGGSMTQSDQDWMWAEISIISQQPEVYIIWPWNFYSFAHISH